MTKSALLNRGAHVLSAHNITDYFFQCTLCCRKPGIFYKQEFLSSFKQFLPHPVTATHCDKIFHSFSFPSALFADVLVQLHTSFPESGTFLSSFDLSDLLEDLELSRRSDALCKRQGAVDTKKRMKTLKP